MKTMIEHSECTLLTWRNRILGEQRIGTRQARGNSQEETEFSSSSEKVKHNKENSQWQSVNTFVKRKINVKKRAERETREWRQQRSFTNELLYMHVKFIFNIEQLSGRGASML